MQSWHRIRYHNDRINSEIKNRKRKTLIMHIEFSVKNLAIALALAASLACGNSIKANSFDFGNLTGAAIDFNGTGGFSFTPGLPAANFSIGDGTAAGLDGSISGNFSIGAITSRFGGFSVCIR